MKRESELQTKTGVRPKAVVRRLFDTPAAAEYLGVSESFLANDRVRRRIIPFVKIGRATRYDQVDLDKCIELNKVGAR